MCIRDRIQGFDWGQPHYDCGEESVDAELDEATYNTLLQRYAELVGQSTDLGGGEDGGIPLDLGAMAIAQRSQKIDFDYLDERFSKWRKAVAENDAVAVKEDLLQQLQREWAKLGQEDQAIARQIVDDLLDGVIDKEDDTKTFRDYLNLYKTRTKSRHIRSLAQATSLVEDLIEEVLDCQMRVFGTGVPVTRYCRVPGSWYRGRADGVGPAVCLIRPVLLGRWPCACRSLRCGFGGRC